MRQLPAGVAGREPPASAALPPRMRRCPAPAGATGHRGEIMLALVVDDDPVIRSFVQSILHAENFATLEAENRAHALDVVREGRARRPRHGRA